MKSDPKTEYKLLKARDYLESIAEMKRRTTLFLVCALEIGLILFVATWAAWAEKRSKVYEVSSPPSCKNNLGQTVQFRNVDRESVKSAAGLAKRDKAGVPTVYRFAYYNSPYSLQQFIDFHECAHHQTGDVDLPHPPRNSPQHLMNESIADCIATLRIRDELEKGSDTIAQAVIELMWTMREIGFPETTLKSRKSNILNCLKKRQTAKNFLDGVLQYRGLK